MFPSKPIGQSKVCGKDEKCVIQIKFSYHYQYSIILLFNQQMCMVVRYCQYRIGDNANLAEDSVSVMQSTLDIIRESLVNRPCEVQEILVKDPGDNSQFGYSISDCWFVR